MTNYIELYNQLVVLGYTDDNIDKQKLRDAVIELFHTLDAQDLSVEDRTAAVDLFFSVATGTVVSDGSESSAWAEFQLGVTRPGETVRVRPDAYTGIGAKHNRLVGTIMAVRGGRVLVKYSGRNDGVGHSHHPDKLEVLVK